MARLVQRHFTAPWTKKSATQKLNWLCCLFIN